MHQNIFTAAD